MNFLNSQIFTSAIIVLISVIIRYFSSVMMKRISSKREFHDVRRSMMAKVINISIFFTSGLILLGIWEVDPDDLAIYLTSIFAVIGVAFFHQRSHLSNITAALILYFNYPYKIGDLISIKDGELIIKGVIFDIGLFFVTLKIEDDKKVKISNTQLMQQIVIVDKIE